MRGPNEGIGGTLLRRWRKDRKLTLIELAAKVEVTAAALSRIECAKRMPKPELRDRIHRATRGGVPRTIWG